MDSFELDQAISGTAPRLQEAEREPDDGLQSILTGLVAGQASKLHAIKEADEASA